MPSNLLLIGFKKAGDVGAGPLYKLYSAVLGCAITMNGQVICNGFFCFTLTDQ